MKQIELVGPGSIEKLKEILVIEKVKNIFIVCGKKSYRLSGAEGKLASIFKEYKTKVFNDFSKNPKYEDVLKGISTFKKEEYDLVIAIGGGSVIDMAKLINFFAFQEDIPKQYISCGKTIKKGLPLVAVPTTIGTGSEATKFAVVYLGEKKYSVEDRNILPKYVILDAKLSLSLTSYVVACSGMDALCQSIESFWSRKSTYISKNYARKGIKLCVENIKQAVNSSDTEFRHKMLLAANYSGKAINISKTTAAHAFSYILTVVCGIPHGHAVALFISEIMEHNSKIEDKIVIDVRGKEYLKNVIIEVNNLIGCENVAQFKTFITNLMLEIGLKTNLIDLCNNIDIDKFITGINEKRLNNNPVKITKEDCRKIFTRLIDNV